MTLLADGVDGVDGVNNPLFQDVADYYSLIRHWDAVFSSFSRRIYH